MAMLLSESGESRLNWRKSAHSVNGGNCTEVASTGGIVVVRDSQDPDTLVLRYPVGSWRSFLDAARIGRFDEVC
jgi:Domain of unknown function (DUF397)